MTITRSKPNILFEHAGIHTAEYGTMPDEIYDFITGEYGLAIYSLDGTGPLLKADFISICQDSLRSNYDRNAQTNFWATPTDS